MKRVLRLLIPFLLVAMNGRSQDSAGLMRRAFNLRLAVDAKNFYEDSIPATLIVLPDQAIQIYPGEVLYIEVAQDEGQIKKLTAVPEIKDSSKTIIISFTQVATKRVHEQMMLKIMNPLPYTLTYEARMYLLKTKRWVRTDVYPVMAGISGVETWRDIIVSLALSGWSLKKGG